MSSSISSSLDISSILQALTGSSSSGLNVSALVSAEVSAARGPESQWKATQTTLTNQDTLLSQLNRLSTTVYNDIEKLASSDGVMTSLSATSSDSSVATATVGTGAAAGSHTVKVTHLAQTASMYSGAYTSSSTSLPAGSFTITGSGGSAVVTVGSGVDTLDQVASYINGKSIGVTASVVTDSQGARLALVSTASGLANNFTVSNNTTAMAFTQGMQAQDASVTIDGIPVTSSSNTISGALGGVTIKLAGNAAEGSTATISIATSTSSISSAISTFVSDYNTLISALSKQFSYSTSSSTDGGLSTNAAARSLQSDLLGLVTYSTSDASAGDITTLSALGISMNDDGTLSLDSSKLSNVVSNDLSKVQNFFQGSSSNGFANKVADVLNMYTDTTDGAFIVDINNNKSQISELQSRIDDLETYISGQEPVWTTKYSKAASELLSLPSKLKQIDAMLGNDSKD